MPGDSRVFYVFCSGNQCIFGWESTVEDNTVTSVGSDAIVEQSSERTSSTHLRACWSLRTA